MISRRAVRNIVWVLSVSVGPATAYLLISVLGRISWICTELHLCRLRIFVFFVLGFSAVWAVYWACFFIVAAVAGHRRRQEQPQENGQPPGNTESTGAGR